MSYILDALRRAEIERERGQVPGLHAQAMPPGLGEGEPSIKARGGRIAAVAAGVLVLLGGIGWWWGSRGAADAPTQMAEGPAGMPVGVLGGTPSAAPQARSADASREAAPLSTTATAPPNQGATGGPPLLVAPPASPAPPAPPPLPAPAPPPPMRAAAGPADAPASPAERRAVPATASNPARTSAPSAAEGRPPAAPPTSTNPSAVPPAAPPALSQPAAQGAGASPGTPGAAGKPTLLSDLPQALRAELPQMLIGGAIYSDQPGSRFVVINGLVVREGETAAPGVTLERIGPKSAVIRWREMRIELPI